MEIDEHEEQFDLLTAAIIGMAVGAGIALLLRRGPDGSRRLAPVVGAVGRGARWASDSLEPAAKWTRRRAKRGAKWARKRGEHLAESVPALDGVTDTVRDYLDAAREAINDTVEDEIKGLRKAIRRQRKRIGV